MNQKVVQLIKKREGLWKGAEKEREMITKRFMNILTA